jgi:hypothetical protein
MKRPRSRARKVSVTHELVTLFRRAIPHEQALWRDVISKKRVMTVEQHIEALAAVQAFDMANAEELKAWHRYARAARIGLGVGWVQHHGLQFASMDL